jgi:hypothetical protein
MGDFHNHHAAQFLRPTARHVRPNAVIHAGADDITLVGVTKAQLQAHTFVLSI